MGIIIRPRAHSECTTCTTSPFMRLISIEIRNSSFQVEAYRRHASCQRTESQRRHASWPPRQSRGVHPWAAMRPGAGRAQERNLWAVVARSPLRGDQKKTSVGLRMAGPPTDVRRPESEAQPGESMTGLPRVQRAAKAPAKRIDEETLARCCEP
ncbi:uncharacterized protein SCHCODRAFT_02194474 [Schizophyllum commune H4-8]|uniref:uncharacterized protein n=1 Tax=Schizophyllum commune (strain H4-8 / FGSC 9210) TaxID=578458 RepID=UPI00216020E4|nr:uncharacterized protein SCHCODRAFT_02194474 [Schizophyllum commune H4-8]KAI5896589.1 hypothetical protein SCHCODRAFT_02194474 [Schizophyllum commune H4-8]